LGKPASRHAKRVLPARACAAAAFATVLGWVAGCGAPGEPTPPSPPVPVAVADLSAHQQGDGVEIDFNLPAKTIAGDRFTAVPAVEILRGLSKADGSPDPKSFRVVYTIPGTLVPNYVIESRVRFIDPVAPAEIRVHTSEVWFYEVRTRLSLKRASADSNRVAVRLFPVPEVITTLAARVQEKAVELSWTAPAGPAEAAAAQQISGYRVYRGELGSGSADAASTRLPETKWKSPLTLLATTEETKYDDTLFDFGKTYAYVVRSVVMAEGQPLESSDSNLVILTLQDTFPPAAPRDLVANVVPGTTVDSAVVDLSWSINLETDLAGYRVYRSEEAGTRGVLVTTDLLLAPAYRDTSVVQGHHYWYSATAVDRAGNESAASAAILVDTSKP
jgi:hypothetical protein